MPTSNLRRLRGALGLAVTWGVTWAIAAGLIGGLLTSGVLLPFACFLMFRAMKPYREEIQRLESMGL